MATKRGPTSSPNNNNKISYRCEARHDTAVGSRPAGVDDTIHSSPVGRARFIGVGRAGYSRLLKSRQICE